MIDFWRRWHMTLSRFLGRYIYIPLGGNRSGKLRRQVNLFITMVVGGIWHGAGWTFIIWGTLSGIQIVFNHVWRFFTPDSLRKYRVYQLFCWFVTFNTLVLSLVFFRSADVSTAMVILNSALDLGGLTILSPISVEQCLIKLGAMVTAFLLPNTHQLLRRFRPGIFPSYMNKPLPKARLEWSPNIVWGMFVVILLVVALTKTFMGTSEFLYYNF